MDSLFSSRKSLRNELKSKRTEAQKATAKVERLKKAVANAMNGLAERERLLTKVKDLKEERDQLLEEKSQAEKEKGRAEEELEKKLQEASDVGYNEAKRDYEQQVRNLVDETFKEGETKRVVETHRSSFLLGFHVGLDYAEVPKVDHRRKPPIVPEVQLSSHLLPSQLPDPGASNNDAEA